MISDDKLKELETRCKDTDPVYVNEMARELLYRRKAMRWILVSERLPKENEMVLTFDGDIVSMGFYLYGYGIWFLHNGNIVQHDVFCIQLIL